MKLPSLVEMVSGIFKPAADLIDELHTSDEERLQQKANLLNIQAKAMDKTIEYNQSIMLAQANIVAAEAKSDSWVTSSWRPITMLVFLALAVFDALGWLPNPLKDDAWLLLQIGLGGYVTGRSVEKVVKTVKDSAKHE